MMARMARAEVFAPDKRNQSGQYSLTVTTNRDDKGFKQHCEELRDIVEGCAGIRPDHGILHAENVPDIVHGIFVEPVLLEQPVPCAGKLRLWKLPEIDRGAAGLDGT